MAIVGVSLYMLRRCYKEKTSKINLKKEIKKRFRLGENDNFINDNSVPTSQDDEEAKPNSYKQISNDIEEEEKVPEKSMV